MSHISWNLMAALQPVVLQQENGKSETERRTASVIQVDSSRPIGCGEKVSPDTGISATAVAKGCSRAGGLSSGEKGDGQRLKGGRRAVTGEILR